MKLCDYIRGLRKGKEVHLLEKEAMQDPSLADALDGYSDAEGGQEEQNGRLRKQIKVHSCSKQNHAFAWSIAASILIIVSVGTYFLFLKTPVPQVEDIRLSKEETVSPSSAPTIQEEGNHLRQTAVSDSVMDIPAQVAMAYMSKAVAHVPSALKAAILDDMDMDEIIEEALEPVPILSDASFEPKDSLHEIFVETHITLKNSVRGKVTNQQGEPLVGAAIMLKGTKLSTVTDIEGHFTLKADGHKELSVAYIGYEPMDLLVDTTESLLITMNEDNRELEEVAVMGLGARIRNRLMGAVESLKMSGSPQPIVGRKEFRRYLKENLVCPDDKDCVQVKGKVILTFRVDKEGRPQDIAIKKGLCNSADQEAIRLIEEGPDWTVGDELVKIRIRF